MPLKPSLLRRAIALSGALLTLLPAVASATAPGINQSRNYDPATEAVQSKSLGAEWVRLFIRWEDIQAGDCVIQENKLQDFEARADRYRAQGIQVLLVVMHTSPCFNGGAGATVPPNNPADFGAFIQMLATRFGDRVAAYEIWNEPNESTFWHGGPQPAQYTELLKAAYAGVKAGNPRATVVTGGLAGNDYGFVEGMYKAGAAGYFDAIGVHTDTACLVRSPDFYYREPDGRLGPNVFTAYREVRQVMADHGDAAKKVWMTELGWSTLEDVDCNIGKAGDEPGRMQGVSPTKQAEFLKQAYECLEADGDAVPVALWFSMRDAAEAQRYDSYLGLADRNGVKKPAWDTMASLFAGGAKPTPRYCGGKVDRDKPTASIKVPATYYGRFSIEGSASDPTTPISRMELWVDGKRVENMNEADGSYNKDWFGSTKLSYGKHRVELRAYDEAQNMAAAVAEVTRVNSSSTTAPRIATPRLTFTAKRKRGKIAVNARLLRALTGEFTEAPRGRLRIFFEYRRGGKWRRYSRYTKGISRRVVLNYAPRKPGRWRVYARTTLDAPYKNLRTKTYTFRF